MLSVRFAKHSPVAFVFKGLDDSPLEVRAAMDSEEMSAAVIMLVKWKVQFVTAVRRNVY